MAQIADFTTKFTKFLLFYFRLVGLWPEGRSIFYSIYSVVFLSTFLFLFAFLLCSKLFMLTTTAEVTEALYMSITEFALTIKVTNYIVHYSDLRATYNELQAFKLETETEIERCRRRFDGIVRTSLYYYCLVFMAGSSADVTAFFSHHKLLPFPAWTPFLNWKESPTHYWIVFTYEAISMLFTSFLNVSIEVLSYFLLSMIAFQMEVLGSRLEKLGHDVKFNRKSAENQTKTSFMETHVDLIKQIKLHQRTTE